MVICPTDHGLQADVVFVIEGTAVNGAYINDLKTSYIIPSLEYFGQGNLEDSNYISDNTNSYYGVVVYQAADCLPHLSSDTIGPFSTPAKVLNAIEKLKLVGGKGESHANIAEGLATALQCFEELQQNRDANVTIQKHCILVCNSPPYLLPVLESQTFSGKTAEQLAAILLERNINLSVISPRKIPSLYKLFEKAGGDLTASQTKNYAKDPRHLVLLKGYSLKERPISPPPGTATPNQALTSSSLPITSLPSPLAADSPLNPTNTSTNLLGNTTNTGVGVSSNVGQSPVYRPPSVQDPNYLGLSALPQQSPNMVNSGMVGMVINSRGMIGNNPMTNNQINIQQLPAPPGYHAGSAIGARPPPKWPMPPPVPQQRPYAQQGVQQPNTTQGSALIAQLSLPPSSIPGAGVNQFGQINANSPLGNQQQAQQPIKINMIGNQPNQQGNVPGQMQGQMPPHSGIQPTSMSQGSQQNQAVTSQSQMTPGQSNPQMVPGRDRPTIWQGLLEWIEKPKNATDQQKVTKHVPCQVSANAKDGEPELKADGWPNKLIMQLMPKQLIGNIGGAYLKNSKSVLFHPQPCDALESLTKVMSSGFAGCVHFTSVTSPAACDIKVLILLYTAEKRAYLGFIPNDQGAFVDRLRKVIQQQKTTQIMRASQGAGGGPSLNPQPGPGGPVTMGGTPPQMGANNPPTSQTTQQGMMMTNTITMGGGQITQNAVTSSGQSAGIGGVMGQNVPAGGMPPRIRMQGIQQNMVPQGNQPGGAASNMSPGMMGAPVQQRAPFENQLQAERQQNLDKINQLKQTLEAAQQQEQQYKSQLERISHMKTSQLQEALQLAQQQEMQYKMMDQQRMASQGTPQAGNAQQARMMRPVMANNPGLRHLLQQVNNIYS